MSPNSLTAEDLSDDIVALLGGFGSTVMLHAWKLSVRLFKGQVGHKTAVKTALGY